MGERNVNWLRSKLSHCLLLVLAGAATASAQDWPLPAATPNTNVPCTGCAGDQNGKLTPGYPSVLRYVGRWEDSNKTYDYQQPFRVGRARAAFFIPERNRAYLLIGSAVAAYNIDTFFSKVTAHAPLNPATSVQTSPYSVTRSQGSEVFLFWDRYFYPESGGGWVTPEADGMDRIFRTGIDWDDRNICYFAYYNFGWGMVMDDPKVSDAGLMQNITKAEGGIQQYLPTAATDLTPYSLINVKTTDGSYYVLVSEQTNASKTSVWNVTDYRHAAVKMPDQNGRSIWGWAKNSGGSRVGIVQWDYLAKIYTADALARGQNPMHEITLPGGAYYAVDSDGTNFYFLGKSFGLGMITVMSPNSSGGYDRTDYPIKNDSGGSVSYSTMQGIRVGAGLLTVFGSEFANGSLTTNAWNVRLYSLSRGVPTQISLENTPPGGKSGPFFAQYYDNSSPGDGFVHPGKTIMWDVTPYKHNGKTYLVYAGFSLGDVWEVKAGDSLNGSLKSVADLPNPYSRATAPGPFYGDRQTFTSSLASGNAAALTWTFDDGTSDSTPAGTKDIKHQFGGITSVGSLPVTKHATATNSADSTMSATINVPLARPAVRFGIAGTLDLFTQGGSNSSAPILTSDSFVDASDGAVEGHYTEWVLDGASTKKLPSEPFPAGGCGAHALNFLGHYGAYTATGNAMASVGSDFPIAINGFNYSARPFVVTVKPPPPVTPGSALGDAVFTASVRATSKAADLTLGLATPVTYLWELVGANATTLQQQTGAATFGTIPAYTLNRSVFNTLGSSVRLTATVAAAALGTSCAPLVASASITAPLNAPDPAIVKSGCENAGAPCSFSVTSSGSQTGWTYAWSMTNSNATSTTTTFAPTITSGGSYTVTLVVTNSIGSATKSLIITPAQPLCSSAPTVDNTTFAPSGCASAQCVAGEAVTFRIFPYQWSLDAACDIATWDFGDSTTGSGFVTEHTYANNRTYTVTLTLKGGSKTAILTYALTVGPTVVQPPNPRPNPVPVPGSCPAQTANSAYVAFVGQQSLCIAGGTPCTVGEPITFGGYSSGYDFDCGTTTYFWNFGDNSASSERFAQHSYLSPGTYNATLSITNSGGTRAYGVTVQVGAVTTRPCGTLNAQTIAMTFSGNGCTENSGDCVNTTPVSFTANGIGYNFGCGAHTFDWNYGDGAPHGTTASAAHTYSNAGSYTATLTVSYGQSNFSVSKPVKVTSVSPGGGGCPTMVAETNVYVVFYGTQTASCSSVGGGCPVGEDVQFKAFNYNYLYECGTHSFKWEFGDNTTSSERDPIHKYLQNGTYRVKLTIANGKQSIDLNKTIIVGTGVSIPPRHRAAGH